VGCRLNEHSESVGHNFPSISCVRYVEPIKERDNGAGLETTNLVLNWHVFTKIQVFTAMQCHIRNFFLSIKLAHMHAAMRLVIDLSLVTESKLEGEHSGECKTSAANTAGSLK